MILRPTLQLKGRVAALRVTGLSVLVAFVAGAALEAPAAAQLSPGCTALNAPVYDGMYGSFGITSTFSAGERLTVSASSPSAGATQFQLNHDATAGSPVNIPGSIIYTFPTSGMSSLAWFTLPGGNAVWDVSCAEPVAATFRGLSATSTRRGVVVRWRTASEADALGFHVYRAVQGKRVRVNAGLIPAHGAGAYSFLDRLAPHAKSLRYWVQLVNLDGSRSWYGPARLARP